MSELYRRLSLADRRERAKRERENDRKAREAAGTDKADLLARFRERKSPDLRESKG